MMKRNILISTVIFMLLVCITTNVIAYEIAEGYQLQITLINQVPDPVGPGESAELRFKIENVGTKNAEDMTFEIMPAFPFKLYTGEEAAKNVGSVWGRQIGDMGAVVKHKLIVDKDALAGKNPINARYKIKDGNWVMLNFTVSVQTRRAIVGISSVNSQPEIIPPGGVSNIDIEVENFASSVVKNVKVRLDLSSASLVPLNSSNEKTIKSVMPGKKESADFVLLAKADATANAYNIPVTLSYEDELGNNYSASNTFGLSIGDKPELMVSVEESTVYTAKSLGTVTIKFVNNGLTDIKLMSAHLEDSDEYEIFGSDEVYVGNIDSDDYETADFKISVGDVKDYVELPIKIKYRDANNNRYESNYKAKLHVYTDSEAKKLGLKKSNNFVGILIIIVIVAAGIFWYKRRRKKHDAR